MFDSNRGSRRYWLALAFVAFGLAFGAGLASAQAQKTDYVLNTPYVCPNGSSYTFTKKIGTGYRSMCYYTVLHNGRLFTKAVSACRQMTGYLRGCKLQGAAAPSAVPAAEDWHSRPTRPSYLAAMPYVEKVKSTIKGSSPDDTSARQLTVFNYLGEMIVQLHDATTRYGTLYTPDEMRLRTAYALAAKRITDDYAKTHTPAQAANLQHLSGHYEFMDDQFYRQWSQALLPADFLKAYNHAYFGMLAQYSAHVDQERKQNAEAAARAKAARQAEAQGTPGLPNDPGSVAARRCLELGGSQLQCLGKGISAGFFGLAGMKPSDLFPTSNYTGPTLTGLYKSGNGVDAGFADTKVGFGNCGKLIIDDRPYTLVRNGNQIVIRVNSSPRSFSFLLQPDGRLVGPPSAPFAGKIVTGYRHYWEYKYNKETGQYVPGSGHEVSVPIYAPLTETCNIGTLRPAGAMPSDPGMLTDIANVIEGLTGHASSISGQHQNPPPGIRMAGVYTSPGGLKASFATASVILDCGEAHVRDPYTVERAGDRLLIHVQNPASPFTATLQPDGSLSGPASVAVAGRLATGMTGDQVTYTHTNTTCMVGTLSPHGAATGSATGSTAAASQPAAGMSVAPASPSRSGGNANLSVASGFSARANPLAGRWVFLMDEPMDNVVRETGLHPPAGITACQAWAQIGAACHPATKCTPLLAAINKHTPEKFRLSADGRGAFPSGVQAGTYYVLTSAKVNNAAECWSVRVDLKPGANSVSLSTRNAEELK